MINKKKFKDICKPDCPDRSPSCHSRCEKYLSYRKHLDEINKRIRKEKDFTNYEKEVTPVRSGVRRYF